MRPRWDPSVAAAAMVGLQAMAELAELAETVVLLEMPAPGAAP